jgi:acyl carrier protein
MSTVPIEQVIVESLIRIAPEADPSTLDPRVALRDQIELDSVDFLGFVAGLERRLGVKIPEGDYPKLSTLAGCADYLRPLHVAGGGV